MALFNLRRMSTVTTGTGTITLGSAVTGFKAFSDTTAIPDQTWVTYAIADTANSEQGYGLYSTSGPTLTRNVVESTNSNNPISLSGSAQVFITPLSGDLQSNTAFPTRIRNGSMDIWQKGTSLTVTTGLAVTNGGGTSVSSSGYTADGWIVVPTGASVTVARDTGRLLTTYALKVTGNTSVTDVVVKQRVESLTAASMSSQQVLFQAWVYNNTGGSITPTLTIKHPTATDNYASTSTDVSAVSLQPCANAAWTQVMYVFTASASSALGMEVSIDFGNNFSVNTKYVRITEVDLRVAPGYQSGLTYISPVPQFRPVHEELAFCQRYYHKSYSQGTDIGSNTGSGGGSVYLNVLGEPGTSQFQLGSSTNFSVMRAVPTIATYDSAGTVSAFSYYISSWNNNGTFVSTVATDSSLVWLSGAAVGLLAVAFDYTASAEL